MSHSRRAQILLTAVVLAVAASCGVAGSVLGTGSSVTGTVTYSEQIELTPGATLIVQIRDTSYADAGSELIAEQVIGSGQGMSLRGNVGSGVVEGP